MKFTDCSQCPCTSEQYGSTVCNLAYESEYVEVSNGKFMQLSPNCLLVKITCKDGDFIPEKTDEKPVKISKDWLKIIEENRDDFDK